MDFNFKMRLIGFYNKIGQNMVPEALFVEDAETLAPLFSKSFDSLISNPGVDDVFKSVIKGNSVFILKGENGKLYAYYPSKNIARISKVRYNKQDVTVVPLTYKGWFIPGDDIPIINREGRTNKSNGRTQNKKYVISRSGSDFLISDGKKILPLDWSEDKYISFNNLKALLSSKWVTLVEFETNSQCDDCDGYDYSNCDMSRCKDDCESCSGRRYICNNSCFYHRYDSALRISINQNELFDIINPILIRLKDANVPHSANYKEIYSEIKSDLDHIFEETDILRMNLFKLI